MTQESSDNHRSVRQHSRQFSVADDKLDDGLTTRQAKTFSLKNDDIATEVPESITAGERLPHVSEYSGIKLEALPLKGIKPFFIALLILLVSLLAWEVVSVFLSVLQVHWSLALGYVLLLSVVTGLGLRCVWAYFHDRQNMTLLQGIQHRAARLLDGHDFGKSSDFVKALEAFYKDKPQAIYFQQCLEQMPDYSNDKEVIEHINRVFLKPLDEEAQKRISHFTLQTSAAVAISPWAALDMALSLWRSMKMIDHVAQVYGMRPSLSNRYALLKLVVQQLVFVGSSEVIIEPLLQEMGASSLTAVASTRLSQGLGAGIYSAKIGLAAMAVSRPIAFSNEDRPKIKGLIAPAFAQVKALFSKRK